MRERDAGSGLRGEDAEEGVAPMIVDERVRPRSLQAGEGKLGCRSDDG